MGLDCPAQDPAEIFWRKLYSQVLEMTVRHIQLILTEPECQTLEKRADFFLIFSWHYSVPANEHKNLYYFEAKL